MLFFPFREQTALTIRDRIFPPLKVRPLESNLIYRDLVHLMAGEAKIPQTSSSSMYPGLRLEDSDTISSTVRSAPLDSGLETAGMTKTVSCQTLWPINGKIKRITPPLKVLPGQCL